MIPKNNKPTNLWLALDTSTDFGSIALGQLQTHQVEILCENTWAHQRTHCEVITTHLEQQLRTHHLTVTDLNGIAFGLGPGSFTGVRVTINMAKTLCYSLSLPHVGVSSLRILAQPALAKAPSVLALSYGFRDLIYLAQYQKVNEKILTVVQPCAMTFQELLSFLKPPYPLLVGDGWQKCAPLWPSEKVLHLENKLEFHPTSPIQSRDLLTLLSEEENLKVEKDWKSIKPLYIRGAEAEEKLKQNLIKKPNL
ncbi:MAG: tRNA (adenosine(37)-N6)-threonylcarbamoyltransferase complex dimerization subunit type 1 TsaB [Bdellovibrionales bacterium]|nr:tRNA (adenosine(37)-N6)-threonylcarbamoyltransferase complex dimerization subunit type 1 TsaB [Bdellovibrionales bacterium]